MKPTLKTTSFLAAVLLFVVGSALAAFIFREMRDRSVLISENENERILSKLLASFRNHDDFGSAITSGKDLSERVAGIAVFSGSGETLYSWGTAQTMLGEDELARHDAEGNGRFVIPDRAKGAIRFILRTSKMAPPAPARRQRMQSADETGRGPQGPQMGRMRYPFYFDLLERGEWLYIEILHPVYWREQNLMIVLFPVVEALLLYLVFFVRHLVLRNSEYRERIETQKSLVVLGTAASTLAHEIKNPLLAIRLQTGILAKLYPEAGAEELAIINAEVDRLSHLTYRVNDYLREPRGGPIPLHARKELSGMTLRMCGRDLVAPASGADGLADDVIVLMDPERFRSVFENLVRNAIESGGSEDGLLVTTEKANGMAQISVLDRGSGIAESDFARVFEPFFTTKSRGTGIGLTICQRFVLAAGGSLEHARRPGGGTVARVFLPLYRSETEESPR